MMCGSSRNGIARPEDDLHQLPRRQTQSAATRGLEQPEQDVDQQRHAKHDRSGPRSRHREAPLLHLVHEVEMKQADRVIEEMRRRECKQDQS